MRFHLVDRILSLEPGRRIVAVKTLSLNEEYLRDHFPGFPVIPGVLLLEALSEASAWLVRAAEDFAHSMVVLRQVRNARFGRFVEPGQAVTLVSELVEQDGSRSRFKTQGVLEERPAVSASLVLCRYNLADVDPRRAAADERIRQQLRQRMAMLWKRAPQWEQVCGPEPVAADLLPSLAAANAAAAAPARLALGDGDNGRRPSRYRG